MKTKDEITVELTRRIKVRKANRKAAELGKNVVSHMMHNVIVLELMDLAYSLGIEIENKEDGK